MKKGEKVAIGVAIAGVLGIGGYALYAHASSSSSSFPAPPSDEDRKKLSAAEWPQEMAGASVFAKQDPSVPFRPWGETFLVTFASAPEFPPGTPMIRQLGNFGTWVVAQLALGNRVFVRPLKALLTYEASTDPRVPAEFFELVFSH